MSLRAILLGLCLGLFISGFTMFHDNVIQGTWFISNHLPVAVFGIVILMLLTLNPLLRLIGPRGPLNVSEVAVVAAIGLAACGWPSFNYYQAFVPITATPAHWVQAKPVWQSNQVMSYVPGASDELGHGHVQDWPGLGSALLAAEQADTASLARQIWVELRDQERQLVREMVSQTRADDRASTVLLPALNRIIREQSLRPPPGFEPTRMPDSVARLLDAAAEQPMSAPDRARLNRWLLVESFPGQILPPPEGTGVLLTGSAEAAATRNMIIHGFGPSDEPVVARIPWTVWWPTLRLWLGVGLMLGVASLCLALVVHPQWSRRELLVYPLAQFVTEIGQRKPDSGVPAIAFNRLFWVGLMLVLVVHSLNGLATWVPNLGTLEISRTVSITPLRELFPNVARVPRAYLLFSIVLYPSVIGFAFFLSSRVAFSVGIAPFAFAACGAALLSRGIAIEQPYMGAGNSNLIRFGAFVGMAVIIAYVGRHYYGQLALRTVGLGRGDAVPRYAVWASRGLVLSVVLAVVLLRTAGLDWVLGSLFVLLVMLLFLVFSRIVSETGLFFLQSWWMPVSMLTAMFGIEAIGPTSYILLALASVIFVGDPRTVLMPYLSTGLQIVERSRPTGVTSRVAWPLLGMIVVGLFAAGLATFVIVHDRGVAVLDSFSTDWLPVMPFDELARHLAEMRNQMTLAEATARDGLTSLNQIRFSSEAYGWIIAGIVLVGLCSFARLRLPWWPIHPVLFLIWGTLPAGRLAWSFLIGWLIKLAVVNVAGSRGYRTVLPLMVGLIAGDLLAALLWTGVGVAYYLSTGLTPEAFRVLP